MGEHACGFYLTSSKNSPVEDFLDALSDDTRQKFFHVRELLEEFGHRLSRPYCKYLGKGIFELRFGGIEGSIRVMYFFLDQNTVIFTNAFIKKTDKIPKSEYKLAIERRKIIISEQSQGGKRWE